ncbi:ADP-ribose pyrophosphatase YjhB (NUDIX family) [Actinokineospora baliensis]|uniref:NUDIX hydrolase n=1 Tax=Actinokineospora baliensis TaxID=547056 RepID=UPI0019579E30|nr:NUDIX domain-containing protein [Actinokineospora baliensis]MBM7772452.1 ADP-ribose pyrophosphatase YjhB (NUDIX family) [Actinokineospora baliensis]
MSQSGYFDLDVSQSVRRSVVGAGVCVLDDAGLVLLARADGGFRLPGKPQPAGESLPVAAVRAVEELTGVWVEITGLVGVFNDASEPWSAELAVCFRGRPVGGRLSTARAAWLEPERLAELPVPEAVRTVVEHGLNGSPYFT